MSAVNASQPPTGGNDTIISSPPLLLSRFSYTCTTTTDAAKKVLLPRFRTLLDSLSSPRTLKHGLSESPKIENSPTCSSSSHRTPSPSMSAASEDSPESSGTPITDADSGELPADQDENIEQTNTKQVAQWVAGSDSPNGSSSLDLDGLHYRYDDDAASPPIQPTGDAENPEGLATEIPTILPHTLFSGGRFQSYASFRADKPVPSSVAHLCRSADVPEALSNVVHLEPAAPLQASPAKNALSAMPQSSQDDPPQRPAAAAAPPWRSIHPAEPQSASAVQQYDAPVVNPASEDTLSPTAIPHQSYIVPPTLPGSLQVAHSQTMAAAAAPFWHPIVPTGPQSAWAVHQYNMAMNLAPAYNFLPTGFPHGAPPYVLESSQFHIAPTPPPRLLQDDESQRLAAGTAPPWQVAIPPSALAVQPCNPTVAVPAPAYTFLPTELPREQPASDRNQFYVFRGANNSSSAWKEYVPPRQKKKGKPRGVEHQRTSETQPAAKKKRLDEPSSKSDGSKKPKRAKKIIETSPTAERENSKVDDTQECAVALNVEATETVEHVQSILAEGEGETPLTAETADPQAGSNGFATKAAGAENLSDSPWYAVERPSDVYIMSDSKPGAASYRIFVEGVSEGAPEDDSKKITGGDKDESGSDETLNGLPWYARRRSSDLYIVVD